MAAINSARWLSADKVSVRIVFDDNTTACMMWSDENPPGGVYSEQLKAWIANGGVIQEPSE